MTKTTESFVPFIVLAGIVIVGFTGMVYGLSVMWRHYVRGRR